MSGATKAELDELEKKQRELMKNATPAQKAQLATQNMIIKHQMKNPPVELPIDKDATFEAQSPEKGGRKSRRKVRKTRGRRKTRRGGFGDGAIPYGKRCVFPDSSMRSETRTFAANEIVCYRGPVDTTPKSAYYISAPSPQAHMVEPTLRSEPPTLVPWFMVGKLVDNAGTGAAGQGMGVGTATGPLLARSSGGRRRRR